MKPTLTNQEYCDIQSAITIAIKHAPKDSPEFKAALEKLDKKLWKPAVKLHMTKTVAEKVIKAIKSEKGGCDKKNCHYERLCPWCVIQLRKFKGQR